MKLIPIHRYRKKVKELSDEELLNEYSNAVKVRSNPMYKKTCFDELDKRGLIEHEVIDSDTV